MTTAFRSTLVTVAALLGGCALPMVGPDYQAPDLRLPGRWSASTEGQAGDQARLARWWSQFGDEKLDWLIEQALTSIDEQAYLDLLKQLIEKKKAYYHGQEQARDKTIAALIRAGFEPELVFEGV